MFIYPLFQHNFFRLFLWLPVAIGCGIALYFAQPGPTPPSYYIGGIASACSALWLGWRWWWTRMLCLIALAILCGALASAFRIESVKAPVLDAPIFFKQITGRIEDIQYKDKKTKIFVRDPQIEGLPPEQTPKRISISLPRITTMHDTDTLTLGQEVTLPATLFSPPPPAMPGAYDFARMFYFEQLGAVGFSNRIPTLLESPQTPHTDRWSERITELRLSISHHLVATMGPEMGAVASALMVGEQSRVPDAITDSMRASGIYHILSISGLHMALATGILFFIVRLLLVLMPYTALHWPNKKIAACAGLIGGMGYLLLAGAPVPAVRSFIMVACVLVAILLDRKGISLFSLAWAATLILLLLPESLFTASFQLSFAATLAIVALYERWGHLFFHAQAGVIGRIFRYFLGLLLTSLAASFYTSPLAIIHFNRMAIYGIIANMLIVPLSSFWIMPMAMLAFALMPLGIDGPALELLRYGLEWMRQGSDFFASLPYANLPLPSPTPLGIGAIVSGGLVLALWQSRWRLLGLFMIVAGLATSASITPYDLLINRDAKRVAYRSESGKWTMLRGETDSFEAELWARMQGADGMLPRDEAMEEMPELRCDAEVCMIERAGHHILIVLNKRADYPCTSGADIIITDRFLSCDEAPHVIDRDFVKQHGAVGLRIGKDLLEIETTESQRGDWPWSNRNQ